MCTRYKIPVYLKTYSPKRGTNPQNSKVLEYLTRLKTTQILPFPIVVPTLIGHSQFHRPCTLIPPGRTAQRSQPGQNCANGPQWTHNLLSLSPTIGIFVQSFQYERIQHHHSGHQRSKDHKVGGQSFFGQGKLRIQKHRPGKGLPPGPTAVLPSLYQNGLYREQFCGPGTL